MKDIRIFVASSKELERERNELAYLVLAKEDGVRRFVNGAEARADKLALWACAGGRACVRLHHSS